MQSQLKVLAPVITRDVTLPNTSKKVPMVMVHVPESTTMMAIPLSTLSQMNSTTASTTTTTAASASSLIPKDEEQAKDLLNWTDGIGTLDGCDLRFRINQLGCLELLDSDDESNPEYLASKQRSRPPPPPPQPYLNQQQQCQDHNAPMQVQEPHRKVNSNSATSSNNTSSSSNSTITNGTSGASVSSKKSQKAKQISPGCSLLRDGPDNRRSRASSSATTPTPSSAPSQNTTNNSISSNKISTNTNESQQTAALAAQASQPSTLLEKIIPMKRVNEIKAVIENWSTEDVRNFVDSIPGCAGTGLLFESQQIDGKTLMYLDQKDLVDIVHIKLGPAIKIHNAIVMLKP